MHLPFPPLLWSLYFFSQDLSLGPPGCTGFGLVWGKGNRNTETSEGVHKGSSECESGNPTSVPILREYILSYASECQHKFRFNFLTNVHLRQT